MNPPNNFRELVNIVKDVIDTALPVVTGLALLVFVWGLAKFIFRIGGDEKAVNDGKNLMLWGLVALFIMVSLISILAFFHNDIGFSRTFGLPLLPPFR
ncbi:MAG: hypothetical protein COX06_00485 [Candidatus Zambryskibacteria bacterium CG22_combo_CG10-13_8_21_14_all_42_17]|uniref:Uncharacterized protein n=1 Tax=Candidatus Zambryskibacteria bacterium CG22_combo_CG10-13_8_21_14_all_42_17 TaxID=1975118 RepID=A0A2H0BE67_9BACT|nr:MAG: hypothetical protein COX06_00485 [Candidatus Zambryskibacteria bacterium CG22_combo_CG10-13_8_21_14_all_42_17]